ncbi:conserved hypothetical protein [delta proteobacterium NaphS2]|nr:conserved hypothetical protein [delta proteobacterium NaphS2]
MIPYQPHHHFAFRQGCLNKRYFVFGRMFTPMRTVIYGYPWAFRSQEFRGFLVQRRSSQRCFNKVAVHKRNTGKTAPMAQTEYHHRFRCAHLLRIIFDGLKRKTGHLSGIYEPRMGCDGGHDAPVNGFRLRVFHVGFNHLLQFLPVSGKPPSRTMGLVSDYFRGMCHV